MNIREQVAKLLHTHNEVYLAENHLPTIDITDEFKIEILMPLVDQILSLIIKELTVIGDEEAKTVILKHCSPETKACDVVYTDIERALAQLQHAHTIKQLRGE